MVIASENKVNSHTRRLLLGVRLAAIYVAMLQCCSSKLMDGK